MGSMLSLVQTSSFRVTPVLYAFTFTTIAFLFKYIIQESLMMILKKQKDGEPNMFDDIKQAQLDDLPKNLHNQRSMHERLRRIKKEDFESLLIFIFITTPYLIFTDSGVLSNFSLKATGMGWSDLGIVNSIFGCMFIVSFIVIRLLSLGLTFYVSKTSVQNVMRIVTFGYFALFLLYSFIMIFVFNYVPDQKAVEK